MATRYWVGGAGTWSTSTTKWSATSGGASGATAPTSADDVIIDAASGTGAFTISLSGTLSCKSLTITGLTSGLITISGTTASLNIYGSVAITAGKVTWSHTGALNLVGTTASTLDFGDLSLTSALTVNGVGGTYTLTNNIISTRTLTCTAGGLSLGTYSIECSKLLCSGTSTFNFDFGVSGFILVITGGTGGIVLSNANLLVTGTYPLIKVSGSTSACDFRALECSKISLNYIGTTGSLGSTITPFYVNDLIWSGSSTGGYTLTSPTVYGNVNLLVRPTITGTTTLKGSGKTLDMTSSVANGFGTLKIDSGASYTNNVSNLPNSIQLLGTITSSPTTMITGNVSFLSGGLTGNTSIIHISGGTISGTGSLDSVEIYVYSSTSTISSSITYVNKLFLGSTYYIIRSTNCNSFGELGSITSGKSLKLERNIIVNTLSFYGVVSNRSSIESYIGGTVRTITVTNSTAEYINFSDISSVTALSGTGFSDGGNNTNIVFDAPRNLYARSTGSISGSIFSTTYNGMSGTYALYQDNIILDELTPIGTITMYDGLKIGSLNTTGFTGTLSGTTLSIFRDVIIGNTGSIQGIALSYASYLGNSTNYISSPSTYAFAGISKANTGNLVFNNDITTGAVSVTAGSIYSEDKVLKCSSFTMSAGSVYLNNTGKIQVTGTTGSVLSITGSSANIYGSKNIELPSTVVPTGIRTVVLSSTTALPNFTAYNESAFDLTLGVLNVNNLNIISTTAGATITSTGVTSTYGTDVYFDSEWSDTFALNIYSNTSNTHVQSNTCNKNLYFYDTISGSSGITNLYISNSNKGIYLVSGNLKSNRDIVVPTFTSTGTLTRSLDLELTKMTITNTSGNVFNISGSNISIIQSSNRDIYFTASDTVNKLTIVNTGNSGINARVTGNGLLDISDSIFSYLDLVDTPTITTPTGALSFTVNGSFSGYGVNWSGVTSGTLTLSSTDTTNGVSTGYPRNIVIMPGSKYSQVSLYEDSNTTGNRSITIGGSNSRTTINSIYSGSVQTLRNHSIVISNTDVLTDATIGWYNPSSNNIGITLLNSTFNTLHGNIIYMDDLSTVSSTLWCNGLVYYGTSINGLTNCDVSIVKNGDVSYDTLNLSGKGNLVTKSFALSSGADIKGNLSNKVITNLLSCYYLVTNQCTIQTSAIAGNSVLDGGKLELNNGVYVSNMNLSNCIVSPAGSLILGKSAVEYTTNTGVTYCSKNPSLSMF